MTHLLERIHQQFDDLQRARSLNTKTVRSFSAELFRILEDPNPETVFPLCEQLLKEKRWPYNTIAFDWAHRMRNQYQKQTFPLFERWLMEYVSDWGDCDDFCTHAFGELVMQQTDSFPKILEWTHSPQFPVRRASAVVLILPIRRDRYQHTGPLRIAERLLNDAHYLVVKGYGWMLKVLAEQDLDAVIGFIQTHKDHMPRLSLRYAIEKMDPSIRSMLMQK